MRGIGGRNSSRTLGSSRSSARICSLWVGIASPRHFSHVVHAFVLALGVLQVALAPYYFCKPRRRVQFLIPWIVT